MITILTEKPSAAKNFAKALGGTQGTFNNEKYEIVSAHGHLFEFRKPEFQVPNEKIEDYRIWDMAKLPWNYDDFSWTKEKIHIKGITEILSRISDSFKNADEVVIGTDVDPSGEGELIAFEILQKCNWTGKTSRMYFADESKKSIQQAFIERKIISSDPFQDGDFVKADTRNKWDYLSMQFTRIATCTAGECGYRRILRQGRLKSVMVYLVGMQEDAIANYKKIPFYEARFKDENGIIYAVDKENAVREAEKSRIDLTKYHSSKVIKDSETKKKTSPGKLLDLAGLAAIMAAKGYKPDTMLSIYQKMYENQIVSYPRTEDKKITPEQFSELLPVVDRIAALVGVDKNLLTHRQPRATHVSDKAGAHGANRPGPNVPESIEALKKEYGDYGVEIYTILAKNYLAILAEDYEYIQEKGHIEDFPEFKGTTNIGIPGREGFKLIFDNSAKDTDSENPEKHLGTIGEPFIHEGANKKPEKPTMKWLIEKQLEKYNVGTGATRTSTLAEITRPDKERGLMNEKKGVLSLTENGQMSYCLLQGSNIASIERTEELFSAMKEIGQFNQDPQSILRGIADLVIADFNTMQKNKTEFIKRFGQGNETAGPAAKKHGIFQPTGESISFKKKWGTYEFSEVEMERLLAGEEIEISYIQEGGNVKVLKGNLQKGTYKGFEFWGFQVTEEPLPDNKCEGIHIPTGKTVRFNNEWGGHKFTEEEIYDLLAGEKITIECISQKGTLYKVVGQLKEDTYKGKKYWGFVKESFISDENDDTRFTGTYIPTGETVTFKREWGGHRFTDEELEELLEGKEISITYTKKKGGTGSCTGKLGEGTYKKKKFWGFQMNK